METIIQKMAENWIEHTTNNIGKKDVNYNHSSFDLDRACFNDPETAISAIIFIIKKFEYDRIMSLEDNVDKVVLTNLAAGPLEDILSYHGKNIITKIQKEAQNDKRVAWTLSHVWKNDISEEVWEKVKYIVNTEL